MRFTFDPPPQPSKPIAHYQDGRLELQDVPRPTAPPGGALVRTTRAVSSLGTEKMKAEQASMNLLPQARACPDQLLTVLDTARTLGWKAAYEQVKNRLETPTPLGSSAAGVVVEVHPAEHPLARRRPRGLPRQRGRLAR